MKIEIQAARAGRSTLLLLVLWGARAGLAAAQDPAAAPDPDSLARAAAATHPMVRAAAARVEAARQAVGPAGTPPDPMLMVGLVNQALPGSDSGMNEMAMKTIGIGQTLPYPGKLRLDRRVMEAELAAAERELQAARVEVAAGVKRSYYEIAFLDQALEILRRNESLLANLVRVAEARYGVGEGNQADVLEARLEVSRLAEQAAELTEERRMALARLNGALQRGSEEELGRARVPERIVTRVVPSDPREIRFTSVTLGARAADSPLPRLAELEEAAIRGNPELRAHEAMILAQVARVEVARRSHLPDFDLSVEYGQRDGMPDLVSAAVSIPVPLRRAARQDRDVKGAEAELAALEAEHHQKVNEIRAGVAESYASLEQQRTQIALYLRSIVPQARAALESGTASFQVGRVDFMTLIENQATLYEYEIAYHRALTSFASRLAELERLVGEEILR